MAAPPPGTARDFPWWLVATGLLGVGLLAAILLDPVYGRILATLSRGIGVTTYVTAVAFALASALGLGLAVCVLSGSLAAVQALVETGADATIRDRLIGGTALTGPSTSTRTRSPPTSGA